MKRFIIVVIALLAACANQSETSSTNYSSPPVTPNQKTELKIDAELEAEFAKIAADAKGKVGVAAVLLQTGDAAFLNADDRFPMQSVYKLPIAMAVMERVKRGELKLDQKVQVTPEDFVRKGMASPLRDKNPSGGEFTIRELIRLSLVDSDGTASDVQLRILGGAEKVQSFLTEIGISDLKVVNTEKEIGRDWETQYQNWSTPNASVDLLRWLHANQDRNPGTQPSNSAKIEDRFALLIRLMAESVTGPKRLKGLLPKGGLFVPHKTGTGGTREGITSATNDIGLITIAEGKTVAIAVFVSDSPADEKTRESVIARTAKAVEQRWNRQ